MLLPEQRLHPDSVPGQKQALLPLQPDSKGVDAVELFQAAFLPLNEAVKQHLCV